MSQDAASNRQPRQRYLLTFYYRWNINNIDNPKTKSLQSNCWTKWAFVPWLDSHFGYFLVVVQFTAYCVDDTTFYSVNKQRINAFHYADLVFLWQIIVYFIRDYCFALEIIIFYERLLEMLTSFDSLPGCLSMKRVQHVGFMSPWSRGLTRNHWVIELVCQQLEPLESKLAETLVWNEKLKADTLWKNNAKCRRSWTNNLFSKHENFLFSLLIRNFQQCENNNKAVSNHTPSPSVRKTTTTTTNN